MGNGIAFRWIVACAALICAFDSAQAQTQPDPNTINQDDYVQLEVKLTLSGTDPTLSFDLCPPQRLWEINLRSLLDGEKHITLGVSISGPHIPVTTLTPVSIVNRGSGFLGLSRECTISIDQIIYRSPLVSVRRNNGQPFRIGPSYVSSTSVNPGVTSTITSALSVAGTLTGIPAESTERGQTQIQNILGTISVNHTETLPKTILVLAGPVPPVAETTWVAPVVIPARRGRPARNLVLTARLIPVRTLISDPPNDASGKPLWTPTVVLSSAFNVLGADLNPSGTLGGHVTATAGTDLTGFRNAATLDAASGACGRLQERVAGLGLSLRDGALLMWALTHSSTPNAAIKQHQIDDLGCLAESWQYVPAEVQATRVRAPVVTETPPPRLLVAPTVLEMKATTQIDDAFARFFVAAVGPERRRNAEALFAYPLTYTDSGSLILPTATIANAYEWNELQTVQAVLLQRVGCYAYVAAPATGGRSRMFAIGELVSTGRQVLLTSTFANAPAGAHAKIESLAVADSVTEEEGALMRAAQSDGQCSSGYAPALLFSR